MIRTGMLALAVFGLSMTWAIADTPTQREKQGSGAQAGQPRDNAQQGHMTPIKLDGEWTVAYAEMDGKKLEGKGFTQVMVRGNVITCKHDGKEKSWRLDFGPHNMVRCTELWDGKSTGSSTSSQGTTGQGTTGQGQAQGTTGQGQGQGSSTQGTYTHHGVYIASQEYFCLSMHKGRDMRMGTADGLGGQGQGGQARQDQAGQAGGGQAGQGQAGQGQAGQQRGQNQFGGTNGAHGSAFVLILHRSGSTGSTTGR